MKSTCWGGNSKSNEMIHAAAEKTASRLELGIHSLISELKFSGSLRKEVTFTNYLAIGHFNDRLTNCQIKKKLRVIKDLYTLLF